LIEVLAPSYAVARGDFDVERWFSLEQGGPLRLRVSRQGWFGKTELSVDRVPLGSFDVKELRQGQTLPLPDGTLLYVQLKRSFGDAGLLLERNGAPLPGSLEDPSQRMKVASSVFGAIAALTLLYGFFTHQPILLLVGLAYAIFSWLTSRGSRVALVAGTLLYALDMVAFVVQELGSPAGPSRMGAVVTKIFFLIPLVKAVVSSFQSGPKLAPQAPAPEPPPTSGGHPFRAAALATPEKPPEQPPAADEEFDCEAFMEWLVRRGVSRAEAMGDATEAVSMVEAAGGRVLPKHVDAAIRAGEAAHRPVRELVQMQRVGDAIIAYQTERARATAPAEVAFTAVSRDAFASRRNYRVVVRDDELVVFRVRPGVGRALSAVSYFLAVGFAVACWLGPLTALVSSWGNLKIGLLVAARAAIDLILTLALFGGLRWLGGLLVARDAQVAQRALDGQPLSSLRRRLKLERRLRKSELVGMAYSDREREWQLTWAPGRTLAVRVDGEAADAALRRWSAGIAAIRPRNLALLSRLPFAAFAALSFVVVGLVAAHEPSRRAARFFGGSSSAAECDGTASSAAMADTCYDRLAERRLDPDLCGKIHDRVLRDSCYSLLAGRLRRVELCSHIEQTVFVAGCVRPIAMDLGDPTSCERISGIRERNDCIGGTAQQMGKSEPCLRIELPYDRDRCIAGAANKAVDAEQCRRIGGIRDRDACISSIAFKQRNAQLCDSLEDPSTRVSCLQQLVQLTEDGELCTRVPPGADRNSCFQIVATRSHRIEWCGRIEVASDRDQCYGAVNWSTPSERAKACALMETPSRKESCYIDAARGGHDASYCTHVRDELAHEDCLIAAAPDSDHGAICLRLPRADGRKRCAQRLWGMTSNPALCPLLDDPLKTMCLNSAAQRR
jgi:hypothetical protein